MAIANTPSNPDIITTTTTPTTPITTTTGLFCRWTVSRKSLPFLHLNFGFLLLGFTLLDTLDSASFGFFYLRNSRSPLQTLLTFGFLYTLVFFLLLVLFYILLLEL